MNTEYHKWHSPNLHQDMELKVYGHFGIPLLVFPCAGGRFFEFEDFRMLDAISAFINEGRVKVFTIDSIDNQTWLNHNALPEHRAARHEDYDRYVIKEVIPFIHHHQKAEMSVISTGCSLGAYHAFNFHLRHPDAFRGNISLSGVYSLKHFVGNHFDEKVYLNSPIDYLPSLGDPWFLDHIRNNRILLSSGQGAWEEECLRDTLKVREILGAKGIPAWVDIWGFDVNHDWPWWLKQMPIFLNRMLESFGF